MHIGIVGGTGKEGRGLGLRWARAKHTVSIGSRDAERARATAAELSGLAGVTVEGGSNAWAAERAEVVLLAVPYSAHRETLAGLAPVLSGRILIDITVPLNPPKVRQVHLPPGQAAAIEAHAIVGPTCPVVATLHHVSSAHLADADHAIDSDVLFCTDDDRARGVVSDLLRDLGLRPVDAGPLQNAIALESLTPVLLHINKAYKSAGSGLRITGI